MSLEQLTKNELVKQLRESQQANKALQAKLNELENIGNTTNEVSTELPYLGVSQFREANGAGGYIVKLSFDLDGRCKILSKEYKNESYKVNWEAVKFLEEKIEKQTEFVGNSTVQEDASNEVESGDVTGEADEN